MGHVCAKIAMALLGVSVLLGVLGAASTHASATLAGPYPGAQPFRSDGVLTSAPATVHQPSFGHATFVVGTDGQIYWSTDRGIGWTPLGAPPGGLVGDPAAASWADGRIDVFVRGADNKLWQIWTPCGGCAWNGWLQPVGTDGTLASSPTVTTWGEGRLDLFVLGTTGQIYQRFFSETSWDGAWLPMGSPPPGAYADRPGAASTVPGQVLLFARGNDNRLWEKLWTGTQWSVWFQPPGTETGVLSSAPSAAPWDAGPPGAAPRLTVFVRGSDGHLYENTWDNVWSGWAVIGAPYDVIVGDPAAMTSMQFAPYVIARGTDNRAYAFYPSDPIGTALASFVAGRADNVTAVIYDITTGQTISYRPGVVEHTASTVKVDILATLLTQAQAQGRGLSAQEQSLAVPMIEDSLDSAANQLWVQVGFGAIGAFEQAAGMTQTVPATNGVWGTTTTTAEDRIAMMRQLVFPSPLLSDASRFYLLGLMENITPSQDWGATGGLPPGVAVALKNGFSIINGWQINTEGWVNGDGRNYLIAVLTDGNASEQYGIDTINNMSAIAWEGLGT